MKNKKLLTFLLGFLVILPGVAKAEDEKFSGDIDVGGVATSGRKDSAKAEEYRDLASGATGEVNVRYKDKETDEYAVLSSENILRKDQRTTLSAGRYGEYKLELSYDETPHRLGWDINSIYSGVGTANLTLPDDVQASLGNPKDQTDLVSKLNNMVATQGHDVNLEILRKTGKLKVQYEGFKPFTFRVDVSSENRDGQRAGMGSFGFGNVVELVQPISYNTTQTRLTGDYNTKDFYLTGNYYLSVFKNDSNSLSYDNPFRVTDSTSSDAYINPTFANGVFVNNGAGRGVLTLAPDNLFHGPSVTASIRNLPWKTNINLASSLGWMMQDEEFLAYTSNAAIQGSGAAGTFDASNPANLPVSSPDASVMTSMYSIGATSHPINWLDATAKYRYYDYNNNMDQITFPGVVAFDSSWESGTVSTKPTSYTKQTGNVDLGARVEKDTRLGLLYRYNNTERENREVANQSENTVGASLDNRFSEMLSLKTKYEKSYRHAGNYDFSKPFGGEDMPNQLPLLRKYYEASRDMDAVHVLATVTPADDLDITGGLMYGNSNYDKSVFGMLDDRQYQLSADADYAAASWLKLNSFYSYEHHNGSQAARQWAPGSIGDPYLVDTGFSSNSNWTADSEDVIHTVGAGATFTIIPKELFLDINYAYTKAEGNVSFDSPLGTSKNDSNAFIPGGFDQVDNSIAHRINPSLRYRINKDLTASLGYLWEKFSFSDFAGSGFSSVPVNASGAYNGAILGGSYPFRDYELNMFYASLKYRF